MMKKNRRIGKERGSDDVNMVALISPVRVLHHILGQSFLEHDRVAAVKRGLLLEGGSRRGWLQNEAAPLEDKGTGNQGSIVFASLFGFCLLFLVLG